MASKPLHEVGETLGIPGALNVAHPAVVDEKGRSATVRQVGDTLFRGGLAERRSAIHARILGTWRNGLRPFVLGPPRDTCKVAPPAFTRGLQSALDPPFDHHVDHGKA